MNVQPHVVFRGMASSPSLTSRLDEGIAALEQYSNDLVSCHVAVEKLNHHHRNGEHFHVHLELTVPGTVLVVGRNPIENTNNEDPMAAVNAAFATLERQLREHERQRQGHVKHHEAPSEELS
jgi:ribosomal subunit interface protein